MMAAILNSTMLDSYTAILESDTFLSSLRFTQKHSPSTLTQSNSIWLTWWWLPSWILPSSIQPFCTKLWVKLIQSDSNLFILTQLDDGSHLEFGHLEFGHLRFSHLSFSSQTHSHLPRLVPTICTKKTFTHSFWLNLMMAAILNSTMLDSDTAILDSDTFLSSLRFTQKQSPSTLNQTNSIWLTWWWQPSWILPCWIQTLPSWIQTPSYLLSDSLKNTLPPFWIKLIQSDSNSFILTWLDDGSHLEFCHLGFSHQSFSSQTHSHLPRLVPTICTKKTSLTLPSPPFAQKILHSFILTQLDDGSHLEFYHVGLKNLTHSFWLNLMMAAILNSAMLDSDTLFSSLRFTEKHSPSTLNQTNSIWLKLIHSHLTWWWQPSWILPSWIQSPKFFLSNSLTLARIGSHHLHKKDFTHTSLPTICTKNTSLIHSDSTWWWQPSWILPCWIQTPCFLLSDSLKNTLTSL